MQRIRRLMEKSTFAAGFLAAALATAMPLHGGASVYCTRLITKRFFFPVTPPNALWIPAGGRVVRMKILTQMGKGAYKNWHPASLLFNF
jgi:hypothetical protein